MLKQLRNLARAQSFRRPYSYFNSPVLFEKRELDGNSIAILSLNRPQLRNAFNTETATLLVKYYENIKSNPSYRAIILTGSGSCFCSGADLKERNSLNSSQWREQHLIFQKMFKIGNIGIPTIAAVESFALAGGFELALNCDMIVCSEDAKFGLPEASRGIMPGGNGTQLLSRLVGPARSKEIILTARQVEAKEALNIGIVVRVVPNGTALQASLELAKSISKNAPLSVKAIKASIDQGSGLSIEDARNCELKYYNTLIDTEDRHEGIRAFNEKRNPRWSGK
jgi:enoyl-CoA hydratase/carnithine racemase